MLFRPISLLTSIAFCPMESKKRNHTMDLVGEARTLAVTDPTIYSDFMKHYKSLIIVNPTKRKFKETVMDFHFYELMRKYANSLEKDDANESTSPL